MGFNTRIKHTKHTLMLQQYESLSRRAWWHREVARDCGGCCFYERFTCSGSKLSLGSKSSQWCSLHSPSLSDPLEGQRAQTRELLNNSATRNHKNSLIHENAEQSNEHQSHQPFISIRSEASDILHKHVSTSNGARQRLFTTRGSISIQASWRWTSHRKGRNRIIVGKRGTSLPLERRVNQTSLTSLNGSRKAASLLLN